MRIHFTSKMKIHFMGVGGSGMAGISFLASKMGYEVTGCDLEESTAYSSKFFHGHSQDHLKDVDLLVVTPAVYFQRIKDAELVEGERRKIVLTWQEFLGKYLHKGKKVICVAGTHGKSTTTAMVGKLLEDAGLDPLVNLGANYKGWSGGARFGKGDYFVTEADEFYDNFLNYHPEIIILNAVEFDHPDYFKSEKQMRDSYQKFIGNLIGKKILITKKDSLQKRFNLKVFGEHNQKNANMAYLLGKKLGIKEETIVKSLESFPGIERRMELISDTGVKVYDDYAHHPTAIKATLNALREKYPDQRIWAVYEAHSYSRSYALLSKYKGVFDSADKAVIGPIFKARDSKNFGISEESIAKASGHKDVICFNQTPKMFEYLRKNLKYGDIVLVMGAGKSYLWAREIAKVKKIENEISKACRFAVKENVSLKDLTTFRIGGNARYYTEVKDDKDLLEVSKFAKDNNLKIFILGGGSDILVSDRGFDGIVIKYIGKDIKVEKDNIISAQAGLSWDDLVKFSLEHNLQGLECMSGIPGTVGASPIQNIGAYGQEVKDTLLGLRAFEFKSGKFVNFSNKDCEFGYRESFFKKPQNWQRYLITSVTLKLKQYKDVDLSLQNIRDEILRVRDEKLENPKEVGNAGSFFKNPIVENHKLSAGFLIEKAGWKGKTHKGAAVSAKNSLILINKSGKASSSDVYELSKKIIEDVKKKFGITLEPEVQFIGFEKKVAILGYGLEGQDSEKYFKSLGESITILDRKFGENYLNNLNSFDIIVRSPGVYRFLPEIVDAEKEGVEITSSIKIFFDNCPAKIIGVTGTKGKGTTSTLIYEILKKAKKDVYLVGNIGKPYLELLPKLTKDNFVVMELSSFQLIDLTKSPHVAVVLNITLDHLDWHKSKEEYVNAKKNIVRYQTVSDYAVINSEYDVSKSFLELTKANVILFNKNKLEEKYKTRLFIRGEHNLENIAAAVSVAKILKINEDIILKTIREFKGLEHRLELVKEVDGVTFYNDSFATGPQPTIAAIKSFTEPETLILGGSDKGLDYEDLRIEIRKRKNVINLILIGQIGNKIGGKIKNKNIFNLGKSPMDHIVKKAFEITPKGGVVILSPGAASFDMFENYKDRGNQFKKAVLSLKK